MSKYTRMWLDFGLDIKAHDAFLSILRGTYQGFFISPKSCPEGAIWTRCTRKLEHFWKYANDQVLTYTGGKNASTDKC